MSPAQGLTHGIPRVGILTHGIPTCRILTYGITGTVVSAPAFLSSISLFLSV